MTIDPILRRIWRVQGRLARKAGYDPKTYADNAAKAVCEFEKRSGFKFKYADISQLPVRRMKIAEPPVEYMVEPSHHSRRKAPRKINVGEADAWGRAGRATQKRAD